MNRHLAMTVCLLITWTLGCASDGLDVAYAPELVAPGQAPGWRVEVSDARAFTHVAAVGPVPSSSKRPIDPAWTRRVFGRQLVRPGVVGTDVFTAAGQDVPGLVQRAVEAGLARAALHPDEPGTLRAVIGELWVWPPQRSATPRLLYRFELRLQGPAPGLGPSVVIGSDGRVTGGVMGGRLWQRALLRVLEEIEQEVAKTLQTPPVALRHEARRADVDGTLAPLARAANPALLGGVVKR